MVEKYQLCFTIYKHLNKPYAVYYTQRRACYQDSWLFIAIAFYEILGYQTIRRRMWIQVN